MVLFRLLLALFLVDRVVFSVLHDAFPTSFLLSSRSRSVVLKILPFVALLSFFLFDVVDHSEFDLLVVCCVRLSSALVASLELVRLRVACVVASFHLSTNLLSVRFFLVSQMFPNCLRLFQSFHLCILLLSFCDL